MSTLRALAERRLLRRRLLLTSPAMLTLLVFLLLPLGIMFLVSESPSPHWRSKS